MRLLIYSLLGLLFAVAAAVYLSHQGGQVMLIFSDYTIQSSLGIFVFVLLAAVILLYLCIRIVSGLTTMPERLRRRKQSRVHGKAEYFLATGLLALEEGDWQRAEKLFKQGARFSRWPAVNYLGAAKAAQQLGVRDRRDSWLDMAAAASSESTVAVSIARAELQLDQQQTEQAYASLRQLDTDTPGNPRIRSLLLQAGTMLKDWRQMLVLLSDYERNGGVPVTDLYAGQLQAWSGILSAASADIHELNSTWHNVPAKLKKEPRLVRIYVNGRLQHADTSDCEPLIRDALRNGMDPELIRLYGLVQGKDPRKQLAVIEKWLPEHPGDDRLLLAAGRLYKRAALWGRARHCLEESFKINPSAEVCYELATMFESQGDMENANRYYREGLGLAADNK